jgi:hypothetical protein
VAVNESAPHCEMVQQGKVIVHRLKSAPQRSDGIRPLSRVARMAERTKCVASPGFHPAFGQLGEMMVRELAQYEAASPVEVPEYPAIGTVARALSPAAPVLDRKRAYRAPGAGGEKRKSPYADFLDESMTLEVASTNQTHLPMRIAMARFSFHKTLESFDFKFQPSIDAKLSRELATGLFCIVATTSCFSVHRGGQKPSGGSAGP